MLVLQDSNLLPGMRKYCNWYQFLGVVNAAYNHVLCIRAIAYLFSFLIVFTQAKMSWRVHYNPEIFASRNITFLVVAHGYVMQRASKSLPHIMRPIGRPGSK
jgi:hypothetical protein